MTAVLFETMRLDARVGVAAAGYFQALFGSISQ
jgi:hypothetical protein